MELVELVVTTMAIGVGATAATDAWARVRRRLFGTPLPNWAMVGRWIGWLPRGRFRHDRIASTPAVRGERVIGWSAHYGIGLAFAGAFVLLMGEDWLLRPSILPALAFGATTVAAPFLLMQPGMGLGIAASRSPRPWETRVQSLVTHLVFGLGLFASGLMLSVRP